MKMPSTLIYFFLGVFLFWSCTKIEKETQSALTFDLSRSYDETELDLDKFVSDIRIVRLETNKNTLLSYFGGFVGENCIISIDYEKLLLFSNDGKYITTIAVKGKGPNEFTQIDAWTVDKNERHFYFHDIHKDYIYKYDLNDHTFQKNIPFKAEGYLQYMKLLQDSTLAILPGLFANYGYEYFFQSFDGEITGGIKKEPVPHPGAWAGTSPTFIKDKENAIIFQPAESDSVFKINTSGKTPWIVFNHEKPQKAGDETTGTAAAFRFCNSEKIILNKDKFTKTVTEMSASMRILKRENYIYDLKSNSLNKIGKIFFHQNEIKVPIPDLQFQDNNRFVLALPTSSFKTWLNDEIEKGEFSELEIQKLKELEASFSIDDNPIIIRGECK